MARFPHLALASMFLMASACSPACTPPAATAPEPSGSSAEAGNPSAVAATPAGEMIHEAKGVDLAELTDAQRSSFFNVINTEPSACDKPHSLATSLRDDAECRDSLVLAQFIADRLAVGTTPSAVKDEAELIRAALRPRPIDVSHSPVYGNERAPVTVVMFADFQCPHCRAEAPVIRKAIDQFRGRAKLVFKHFPLKMHPEAKQAAFATEAAREQGKFWEMHDLVFANQDQLSDDRLLGFARQLGLDVEKFKRDFESPAVRKRVEDDRGEGEELDIPGTPAVFVNGREFTDRLFGGTIEGWIDEALKR